MHPIRWSTLVLTLLLLAYLLYAFNTQYSKQEVLVESEIKNLTLKYQSKKAEMSQFYVDKISNLQQELTQLKTESKIRLVDLDDRFQNQKYYMNTTLYRLHQLYLPTTLQFGLKIPTLDN